METNRNQDPKHSSSSVEHGGGGVMVWACMAATGADDGAADGAAQ